MDAVCKGANVEFLSSEKYLGGRLVSLIIGGSVTDIRSAIEIAEHIGRNKQGNPLKMALAITNPHEEIMKYILPERQDASNTMEIIIADKESLEFQEDDRVETESAQIIEGIIELSESDSGNTDKTQNIGVVLESNINEEE